MPLLTLDSVSLSFGHLPLFEKADLRVEPGERIALIGRNGSGKSSLLKVMAGDVPADGGTIWRSPGLRVARLEQDVPVAGDRTVFDEVASGVGPLGKLMAEYHQVAQAVAEHRGDQEPALARLGALQQQLDRADGWRLEQKVEMVISRLSLPADRPVGELSGGWRRRTLLGKALVSEPDLLLLDEPTNHLDIEAIEWLEEYLRGYAGALLFVTHDRTFLSSLATRIVELDRGRLTSWPGRYETYLAKKADALETESRELERLDKKLEKEEAWLRQGVKARRTRNEGRVRDLMRLREQRAAYRAQDGSVRLLLAAGDQTGRLVFEAEDVSKSFDGQSVIRNYSQRILRGDRVGLIGPNGSGKTTLLRLLVGELEPDAGTIRHGTRLEVAYFDQQREQLDPDRSVADTVNDGNDTIVINGQPRHVIGYLADFLFPRERAVSPVRTLSGGERNRLLLARLFAKPANVLVLDEPTNDLDIETLELLEELVSGFEGTILLVSHDRAFLDNVVTSTLAFEGDGRVVEYVGGWADYQRQRAATLFQLSTPSSQGPTPNSQVPTPPSQRLASGGTQESGDGEGTRRQGAPRRKLSYNETRELATLPERIAALEAEQEALTRESESAAFYKASPDRIRDVLARLDTIGPELETAIARWLDLEERSG